MFTLLPCCWISTPCCRSASWAAFGMSGVPPSRPIKGCATKLTTELTTLTTALTTELTTLTTALTTELMALPTALTALDIRQLLFHPKSSFETKVAPNLFTAFYIDT